MGKLLIVIGLIALVIVVFAIGSQYGDTTITLDVPTISRNGTATSTPLRTPTPVVIAVTPPVVVATATPTPTPTVVPVILIPTPIPAETPEVPPVLGGGYTFTPTPSPTSTPEPTVIPTPTVTPLPTVIPPTPNPTATPIPQTEFDLAEARLYMLELVNLVRLEDELDPMVLGENGAAQLHAEASLEGCFLSHWSASGLQPYMRYSLAGGYQSNQENGVGLNYCITPSDGRPVIQSIEREIERAMEAWMNSPGHRSTILDPTYRKVNIGLAWDRYNFTSYQLFEGDHITYDHLPRLEDSWLTLSGSFSHGVQFDEFDKIHIYYDPPPASLNRGQLARTHCYDHGRPIGVLRSALAASHFSTKEATVTYKPCPDPYDIPVSAPAPESYAEALEYWHKSYNESQNLPDTTVTIPFLTASTWLVGDLFYVEADLYRLLATYGDGVYTIVLKGHVDDKVAVISEYSLFYEGE